MRNLIVNLMIPIGAIMSDHGCIFSISSEVKLSQLLLRLPTLSLSVFSVTLGMTQPNIRRILQKNVMV